MTHGSSSSRPRVLVIGAGIAGLAAARELAARGWRPVVLDKGRGVGGRTSTRRSGSFAYDHGAQYVTARDRRFRALLDELDARGDVRRWKPRVVVIDAHGVVSAEPPRDRPRYVGVPGMNAIAKQLAAELDVRCGVRVARLVRSPQGAWTAHDDANGVLAGAETAIVTTPPAQAAPLLVDAPDLAAHAARVAMRPCWALMAGFEEPLDVPFDAAFVDGPSLAWVARNSGKPGREGGEAWVMHATSDWSVDNLEADREVVARELLAAFRAVVSADVPEPVDVHAHRWRYARGDASEGESFRFDEARRIGVAGDWCRSPRVEEAFLSGLAIAERVAS